jgi:hypothetical protein
MEMDRKKKGVLLLAIAGFLLFFLLMGFLIWAQSAKGKETEKDKKNGNVYTEVQNGEEKPMEDSKIKSYRNSRANIENYWDDMGEELDAEPESEDPVDIVTGTRKEASVRGSRNYTAEDVFGSSPTSQNPAETPAQSSRQDAAERRAMYQRERQAALDEVMRRQEEMMKAQQGASGNEEAPAVPVEETRDRIDIDKVMVRKSGSVTTLEDGFTSVTSSGVSSLEGASEQFFVDEEYPFKCMFVRSGKLKSGERVSIRLLEDMVIDGQLVPKNTHLMAVCSIGSRLDLNVASIDLGGKIINLDYDAYDNDGTKGIYCPGISDRTASQAASTAVSGARSRLTSRIGRAAQDVVNTGLSLITLSGGETAVQVPAGYQFYLVKSRRK